MNSGSFSMDCGSKHSSKDSKGSLQLVVSLFSLMHQISILTFSFDQPTPNDTYNHKKMNGLPVYKALHEPVKGISKILE